ncbi:MAG: TAT-variant-translocated molybdopterin oxidoreductase [Methylacidiphilales bacterium]|nr:TAT-variant-translocated molybdopterin oxidoreductase [Candidatus Methylacidiphilales bacterium]
MKRVFNHPKAPATGRKYWRSLEEFADTPEFRARLEREFPQGAAELQGDEVTRRGFMQFMGASIALAGLGLTGCRRPEIHAVPYSKGVEWQVPGNALHYATSMPRRGGALPLIGTTYNGRPTKLEGNPNVPGFNGATDFLGQAAILDLYDPDRSKTVLKVKLDQTDPDKPKELRGADYADASWEDFWEELAILRRDYLKNGGDGLAILAEPGTSPTREAIRAALVKLYPKHVWVEFDPWKSQSPGGQAVYNLEKADVILSLDADFLGATDGTVQTIAGFAAGRRRLGKSEETMSRLYAVEARFSLTGGMADHRLRLPSSQIQAFATLLASKLGAGAGNSFGAFSDPNIDAWATGVANDLTAAKGRSLIICGSQQPPAVHMLVAQLNETLGNYGVTVTYRPDFNLTSTLPKPATLSDLAEQISQGTVKTLFVLGGNPAFNAPVDLGFDDLIAQVEQVIRHGLHVDETSACSTTHVPAAHFLEAWGDSRAYDGTYLSQQPLILPLYDGISELELLAELIRLPGQPKTKGAELIIDTFAQITGLDKGAGESFNNAWRQFVHDGFLAADADKTYAGLHLGNINPPPAEPPPKPIEAGKYELNFVLGSVDDGRYANNGWLQELPEPVSKLTWDNALYISPATADALGVNIKPPNNEIADVPDTDFSPRTSNNYFAVDPMTAYPMVKVTTPDGHSLELPIIVAPGQADQSLTLALGWGRTAPRLTEADRAVVTPPLRVAEGAGFNAYLLRTSATSGFVVNVKVEKIDKTYPLAVTQEHNSMEGRGIVREAPLDYYHQHADFVQEIGIDKETPQGALTGYQNYEPAYIPPALNSKDHNPDRPAWGMVIDLNTCVGCSACVIACQAENNIPIVGKFQVLRGREMHWIRNDRYFASDNPPNSRDPAYLEDPQMLIQPMACQQCENAPCEPVCPVNATVHNEEGLNVMAYNRCIGTRYCANNCPYKVRRFNFFNYNDRPIQNVKLPVLGVTNELYLGPFAGKDGPLTYKGSPDSIALQKNPNVSVRMRGVMEKCTYCVQRIEEAKIDQLRKSNNNGEGSGNITIATDSFQVACQQACPAQAIVFGNLNDAASKVAVLKQDERNYGVLAYLGTRPRTTYLGRVRNPNPAMPGAANIGHTSEFETDDGKYQGDADKTASNAAPQELNKLNQEKLTG